MQGGPVTPPTRPSLRPGLRSPCLPRKPWRVLCPPAPRLRRPKNVIHTRPSRHNLSRRQRFFSESNEHLRGSSGWPRESITNPLYCTAGRRSVIWTDLLVYPFTSLKAPGLFLVRNNHERNDFLSDPINAETLMIPNGKIHLLRLVPRPPPNHGAQARGTPGARSSPAPRGLEWQPPALTGPWVKTATGTEGWHICARGPGWEARGRPGPGHLQVPSCAVGLGRVSGGPGGRTTAPGRGRSAWPGPSRHAVTRGSGSEAGVAADSAVAAAPFVTRPGSHVLSLWLVQTEAHRPRPDPTRSGTTNRESRSYVRATLAARL